MPENDPFDDLDPCDGFHIVKTGGLATVTIYCQVYTGGKLFNLRDSNPDNAVVAIKSWNNPTEADQGACTRLYLVLDAVARYLTTGGTWDELVDGFRDMHRFTGNANCTYPGYHLLDSYVTTEGSYQHIFVKDGEMDAVLWEEPIHSDSGSLIGGFISLTDLETIRQEQADDDTIWGVKQEGDGELEEGDSSVPSSLPGSQDHGDEKSPS